MLSLWAIKITVVEPRRFRIASDTCNSVSPSKALVASSKTSNAGLVNIARAIPSLWRCPPLIFVPRSPTTVSMPSLIDLTKVSRPATLSAFKTNSSVAIAFGYPKATFSLMDPLAIAISWGTYAIAPGQMRDASAGFFP